MNVALAPSERLLLAGPGKVAPRNLAGHVATHGVLNVPAGDDGAWSSGIFRAVAESGLLGRGGAGFPAAAKWDAVRRTSRRPMVVVNAMEGEPASDKDRVLLTFAPHLVLDGAEVAAAVIGAPEIVVCVADDRGPAASSIEDAIAERAHAGAGFRRISVERPPGRYVTGEESALVGWLNDRRAFPQQRLDKSIPLKVGRRPALVHNAETLSQLALIVRHGPEWFRQLGSAEAPGTTLVTLTGAVRSPGVIEVELGTPVADILDRAGVHTELSAALVGGYGGAWLGASRLATPLAPGPLADAGATFGVGVVVALPATSCGIAETARLARYLAGESAGQCGPCVFGLPAIATDLEQLAAGRADAEVLDRIQARATTVEGRGGCRLPDGAIRMIRSGLTVFADDVASHLRGYPCPGHARPTVLTFPHAATTKRSVA
ncbi:MAG TPA: NADH-ubiquinone oxidoreductase-F iron-sulfur binding region domain-containing protein [Acidimicrobiales bacterium]|jgi:NADH:ubiquinone oxidoreductase subunit F (NADH-binding)|nr:NADH-ubiquinone oxidoreductase-F iron-sulfur binding region domain-containing protein [Acidimicrobiales bacterium]